MGGAPGAKGSVSVAVVAVAAASVVVAAVAAPSVVAVAFAAASLVPVVLLLLLPLVCFFPWLCAAMGSCIMRKR